MTMLVPRKSHYCDNPLLLGGAVALVFVFAHLAPAQSPPPPPPPGLAQLPTRLDPTVVIPQFDVISVKPGPLVWTMRVAAMTVAAAALVSSDSSCGDATAARSRMVTTA